MGLRAFSFPASLGCLVNQIIFPKTSFTSVSLRSPFSSIRSSLPLSRSSRTFHRNVIAMNSPQSTCMSEDEWRRHLSPDQFRILREKNTERPFSGKYDKCFDEGVYKCAGCGTHLYSSESKFDSKCGWPAFYEGFSGAIKSTPDPDGVRSEITCAACGGHLGHVFKDEGFKTPTNERHCVNSASLELIPKKSSA